MSQDPVAVQITTNDHGKPVLGDGGPLRFSVAHSGGSAIYAFASAGDVGVDIEQVRPLDPIILARTCFSVGEQAELVGIETPKRLGAFFDGWVRKEAVIKADGRGLMLPLQSFTVTLSGAARVMEPPQGDAPSQWCLMEIEAGSTVRAALAVRTRRADPVVVGSPWPTQPRQPWHSPLAAAEIRSYASHLPWSVPVIPD